MSRQGYQSIPQDQERRPTTGHCSNPDCNKPLLYKERHQFFLIQSQQGLTGRSRNIRAFAATCSQSCCDNLEGLFPTTGKPFLYITFSELPEELATQLFEKHGDIYHFRLAVGTTVRGSLSHLRRVFMTLHYWHRTKAWEQWEIKTKEVATQLYLEKYNKAKSLKRLVAPKHQLAYVNLDSQRHFGTSLFPLDGLYIKPGEVDLYECTFTHFLFPKKMQFQPTYLRNVTFDKCRIQTDITAISHGCTYKDCLFESSKLGDQFDTFTRFIDCTFTNMDLMTSNIHQCQFIGDVAFNHCGELPTTLINALNKRGQPYSIDGEEVLPSGVSSPMSLDSLSRGSSRAPSRNTSPNTPRRRFLLWPRKATTTTHEAGSREERKGLMK